MAYSPIIVPTTGKIVVSRQTNLGVATYDLDELYSPDTDVWKSTVLSLTSPKYSPNTSYIFDKSRYNNHGTISGATWTRLPSGLRVLDFDGVDDEVDCGNGASLAPTTAITVEAWVKPPSQANFRVIAAKVTDTNWNTGYALWLHSDGFRFYINSYVNNVAIIAYTADNVWHHVVGTYNNSLASNQINIYKDAVLGTPDTLTAAISAATLNLNRATTTKKF